MSPTQRTIHAGLIAGPPVRELATHPEGTKMRWILPAFGFIVALLILVAQCGG